MNKKRVSPFEYAIDSYINENVSPVDMDLIERKSDAEMLVERKQNIKRQLDRTQPTSTH